MARASGASMVVDTSGFAKLAVALRATEPAAARDLAKSMRAVGALVVVEAKKNAVPPVTWSRVEIPKSVKARASGLTVTVSGKAGWKHPVWSSDRTRWSKTAQVAKPYIEPAVRDKAVEIAAMVNAAIDVGLSALLDREFGP